MIIPSAARWLIEQPGLLGQGVSALQLKEAVRQRAQRGGDARAAACSSEMLKNITLLVLSVAIL